MTTHSIGTGAPLYSTPAAWEAACNANITAAGTNETWIGQLKNQNFTNGGNTVVDFAGVTTDSTHYVELTTEAGASFSDNASVQTNALRYNTANGASMSSTNNYSSGAVISVSTTVDVRLTKLQLDAASNGSPASSAAAIFCDAGRAVIVDRCICESVVTAGGSFATVILAGSGSLIKNSLIVSRATGEMLRLDSGGASAYNCTIVAVNGTVANALSGSYGTPTVQNCAIFGATAIKTGGNTPTYTTCVTNIASPPSGFTGGVAYSTSSGALFENITSGTHDLRIKTGSALIDVGTTDSTNAATDIAGTARPSGASYDVGAWEFVSAGGPVTVAASGSALTGGSGTQSPVFSIGL